MSSWDGTTRWSSNILISDAYRPHVSCIYAEFSVLVLLCCVLFFYFICTGVRIHLEFETAEALAIACIVDFFLDISPSLHYLSFLILINIQYILSMSQARERKKKSNFPYYFLLGLTFIRCHVRIFL